MAHNTHMHRDWLGATDQEIIMANTVQIGGKTFDASKHIKAYGGTWQPVSKTWSMDADRYAKLISDMPLNTKGIYIVGQQANAPAPAVTASTFANRKIG